MKKLAIILLLLTANSALQAETLEITWKDLSPTKEAGTEIVLTKGSDIKGVPDISDLGEAKDPKADLAAFLEDMNFMKKLQRKGGYLNPNLDGKKISLEGYATPLAFDEYKVTELLFVPYKGACIHVPPPPANQIIYVKSVTGLDMDDLYFPMTLIGVLRANSVSTVMAEVGYTMEKALIEPFKRNLFERLFN